MAEVFIKAVLPDAVVGAWNQHVRDFDVANPGCRFEVWADAPDMTAEEIVETLRVTPGLPFSQIFKRSG